MEARLVKSADIAPAVRHFIFELTGTDQLTFVPGQWVSLSAIIGGKEIVRAYSIASPPSTDNRFELCLNKVGDGAFSPYLFQLHPGESVTMQPPMGTFVLREPPRDSVLIATGTGVAPFRSMLKAHVADPARAFTLLFGVRHEEDLLYREEFEEMERQFKNFRFLPTLTQPPPEWKGRRGRVQAHLAEAIGERRDLDIYLCGLRAMVDDLRHILKEMGFDRKQIRYEKYD